MTDEILNISGHLNKDGSRVRLICKIYGPYKDEKGDAFYCRILIPPIVKNEKKVYGISGEQATELSKNFVRKLLSAQNIFDGDGKTTQINDLLK